MLTLPLIIAAATAGLAGGVHCIGMCGGLSVMLTRMTGGSSASQKVIPLVVQPSGTAASAAPARRQLWRRIALHGGRLSSYMLIGAVLGGLGNAGLLFRPHPQLHQWLFIVGNLALILLGIRLLGVPLPGSRLLARLATWQQALFNLLPAANDKARSPFLVGMIWGFLPCGLLYALAPFAIFAGGAASGAALMAIFGLTALPHLLAGQGLLRLLAAGSLPKLVRYLGSAVLILIGIAGVWYADMKQMPDFLCLMNPA